MSEEKKSVDMCRVCLNTNVPKQFISLFKMHKDILISEHITSFCSVSITKDDGMPDKICSKCFSNLRTCLNFREKCETSDNILTSSLNAPQTVDVLFGVEVKKEELVDPVEAENMLLKPEELFTVVEIKPELEQSEGLHLSNTPDSTPQCHDCGQFFKSKCKLRVHWKTHHQPKSFVCSTCRRLFKSSSAYAKHIHRTSSSLGPCAELAGGMGARVEGEGKSRIFYCLQCDYKSRRLIHVRTHIVTHSGVRRFQCDLCPLSYTQRGSLMNHKEVAHSDEAQVRPCHICGKTFKGRSRLYKHIRTHSAQNFICDICNKIIKGKKALQMHMIRHSGIKSFTCEHCAASFFTGGELINHKKRHASRDKKVKCEYCEYHAASKTLVRKHMKHHINGDKPYSCKVCGQFFNTDQKLQVHERIHYETKKFLCPLCPKSFFCRRSVSKHVIAVHKSRMLQNRVYPSKCEAVD